jgi:glycogen(starch) synthase
MRILIINSEYPPIGGGAGNASANLASELVLSGQEVTVLTAHFNDLPYNMVENGVRIRRLMTLRRKQDRSGAVEQSVFLLVGSLGALSLLRRWRPDVIVAFFGVPCGAIAWITKLFAGIPYLVSLRGGDVPGFRPYDFAVYHRLVSPLLHLVWRQAGAVVANSHGLCEMARSFDNRVDTQVIPNGVDIHRFSVPQDRDWRTPRLLFVGRLVYQKGLDILVQALGNLKDLPWTLRLVGDGPHRPVLEDLAHELGIAERIEFTGWLGSDAISDQYQACNMFVFPSRHEGMPNAVLEAMACGLPVIASHIAGNEELVVPGVTGFLVAPEDPRALGEALGSLLPDASQWKQMGLAARRRVEEYYTWDRVASGYLSLLQEMIG